MAQIVFCKYEMMYTNDFHNGAKLYTVLVLYEVNK